MKVLASSACVVLLTLSACGNSKTAEKIKSFADKICACKDQACAEGVEAEYLAWWKDNKRARGSEDDRKEVEKAMGRYAKCHAKLVPPEINTKEVVVPKVNMAPAASGGQAPEAAKPAPSVAPAAGESKAEESTLGTPEASSAPADTSKKAATPSDKKLEKSPTP